MLSLSKHAALTPAQRLVPRHPRPYLASMQDPRLRRLKFRAWHRGTREADYMIGCFFDRFSAAWDADDIEWFEALLDEDDVEVMTWALGTQPVPERYAGTMMDRMRQLDYVDTSR